MLTMDKFVKAEDVKDLLNGLDSLPWEDEVEDMVNGLTTADVEEVVRCGYCQYFKEPYCVRDDDETHSKRINMLTVDFCSRGKRRIN